MSFRKQRGILPPFPGDGHCLERKSGGGGHDSAAKIISDTGTIRICCFQTVARTIGVPSVSRAALFANGDGNAWKGIYLEVRTARQIESQRLRSLSSTLGDKPACTGTAWM